MMKLSKKGEGLIFAGLQVVPLGFSILFFIPDSIVQENPIGVKQYDILYKNEEAQAAQLYLKLAAKKSSEAALINLFETVGIYRLTDDKGGFAKTICGDHIYPLYTSPKGDCVPTFSTSLKSYFQDALARYNEGYDAFPLTYVYNIDFEQKPEELIISTKATKPIYVPLKEFETVAVEAESKPTEGNYPTGLMGGYGEEKIIECGSGDCFSQIADYYYQLYTADGSTLPYVYGGESPYTYEKTKEDVDENGASSFFSGVSITEQQVGSNTYKITEPGFDSAGWLWWIGKHAGIYVFDYRMSINDYYKKIILQGTSLCDSLLEEECDLSKVQEDIQTGDIIFYSQNSQEMVQASIYSGKGQVIHSTLKGLSKDSFLDLKENIAAVYRPNYASGGIQALSLFTPQDAFTGVALGDDLRVVAYGDSITANGGYVSFLGQQNIGTVENKGTIGHTTYQLNNEYESTVANKGYTDIIIFGGINDLYNEVSSGRSVSESVKRISSWLQSMYDSAHADGMRVIAATITSSKGYSTTYNGGVIEWTQKHYDIQKQVNAWILSKPNNVDAVVDVDSKLRDPQDHAKLLDMYASNDKLHPNSAGQKIIGEAIYESAFTQAGIDAVSAGVLGFCSSSIDPSFIDEEILAKQRIDMMQLIEGLKEKGVDKIITAASEEFGVPQEILYSIIAAETGGEYYQNQYLGAGPYCNPSGACGLTQITPIACKDNSFCDFDLIKKGDYEMAIRTAAAVIEKHMKHTLNPVNPDYYFLSIAYNRGAGSLQDIIKYAAQRKGVDKSLITWGDIEDVDIQKGLDENGLSGEFNYRQAREHPQKFVDSLSQSCGSGSFQYSFTSGAIPTNYISFIPATESVSDINIDSLDLVTEFVNNLTEKCNGTLSTCVDIVLRDFNEKHKSSLTITMNKEEDAMALDIVDQFISIYKEDQQNCVGVIDIDYSLPSRYPLQVVSFFASGEVYTGDFFDFKNTKKLLTDLSFDPTKTFTSTTKNNKHVDLIINTQTQSTMILSDLKDDENTLDFLSDKELWSTQPPMVGGAVPIDEIAVLKLASAQQIENLQETVVGPAAWCTEESYPITNLELTTNFVSGTDGKTYADLVINAAQLFGVDPSLLMAHKIIDADFGKGDFCKESEGFVSETESQINCIAENDKNAYLQSKTAQVHVTADYIACNAFSDNLTKMWDCIMTTYQGEPYVDGMTSDYLDAFKNSYCAWKNYFEEKGIVTSYELETGPCGEVVEYAKEYIGGAYDDSIEKGIECDNDGWTRTCSINEMIFYPGFTQNPEGTCCVQCAAFITSVFDFALEKSYALQITGNGIDKCDRPLTKNQKFNDPSLLRQGDLFVSTSSSKYGHAGIFVGRGKVQTPARSDNYCYREFIPDPMGEPVFIHSVGPVCYSTLSQLEETRTILSYCRPEVCGDLDYTAVEGTSITNVIDAPLQWIPFTNDFNHLTCKDGKKYYRFQASFPFTDKILSFGVYLENTVPVEVYDVDVKQKLCGQEDLLMVSWSVSKDQEPYSFSLALSRDKEEEGKSFLQLSAFARSAELTPTPSLITEKNKLFVEAGTFRNTFYYLFNPKEYESELISDVFYRASVESENVYGTLSEKTYGDLFSHYELTPENVGLASTNIFSQYFLPFSSACTTVDSENIHSMLSGYSQEASSFSDVFVKAIEGSIKGPTPLPLKVNALYSDTLEKFPSYDNDFMIVVDGEKQFLYLLNTESSNPSIFRTYDVSTSAYGFGTIEGSDKTPTGVLAIKDKIGEMALRGTIFAARQDTGQVATIYTDQSDVEEDFVITRILTLEGKEVANANSYERFIYIHGTPEEGLIGQPASHGCIRMVSDDVIELFTLVDEGTFVVISE